MYLFEIDFRTCYKNCMVRNFDVVIDFFKIDFAFDNLDFCLLFYIMWTDTSAASCRYQSTQQETFYLITFILLCVSNSMLH